MSDDPQWLEWRRSGITATDVADAANGTYGGAYGVVARKLGLVTVEQNAAMDRGHRWQPKIADAVNALTGLYVVGEETWCERDGDPLVRATVDGFLAKVPDATSDDLLGVVEVKTTGRGVRLNHSRTGDQVQWQLHATGLDQGLLAHAVIDDVDDICDGIRLYEIAADPVRQEHLRSVAERLWMHVQAGTLPDPDDPSALDIVKDIYSDADPDADPVDITDLDADVARLVQIKAAIKAVSDERDQLEAKLRNTIGEATHGQSDAYRVSVSNPANVLTAEAEADLLERFPEYGRLTLDRTAFKSEHSDDYKTATRPVGARRITVKELT